MLWIFEKIEVPPIFEGGMGYYFLDHKDCLYGGRFIGGIPWMRSAMSAWPEPRAVSLAK